jgi:translation initiation factor eIF-2B subunit epsilon
LTSEISDDKIYAYILEDNEYAAKILDFRTYGAISHQAVYRWCHPITLTIHDLKLKDKNTLTYTDLNIYLDDKQNISYSSTISNGSVIGKETTIDDQSRIEKSIVGKNCKIGKKVVINQLVNFVIDIIYYI